MDDSFGFFLFDRLQLRYILYEIQRIMVLKTPPQYFNIFFILARAIILPTSLFLKSINKCAAHRVLTSFYLNVI
jgi:hypothetical protein